MFYLSEFDKKKVEGLVYLNHGEDEDDKRAIDCFDEAIAIKDDPAIFSHYALALCYLREYEKAQEYALKAIKGGYDAYQLYCEITVGNLQKVNQAVEVLKNGVDNHKPSACLEMARLHLINTSEPDMLDPFEASKYLELAFEYTPVSRKGLIANTISRFYRLLNRQYPYFVKFKKEDMELHYLKIFTDYGGVLSPAKGANIELFNAANRNDDYSVIDTLYNRFDGESYLIFGLLMLEEEYEKNKTIKLEHNVAFITFLVGSLKTNNGACTALMSLCFASDFEGVEPNFDEARRLLNVAKRNGVYLPERFVSFFKELMNHLDEEVREGQPTAKA